MREPVCSRGGEVTAYSVEGTGPGAACKPEAEEPEPPATPPKFGCRLKITSNNSARPYRQQRSNVSMRVC